jgi:uncharacterized protein YjbJ (UPF0337 family)
MTGSAKSGNERAADPGFRFAPSGLLHPLIVRFKPRQADGAMPQLLPGTIELHVRWNPLSRHRRISMDWNRVEGNWKQFKGKAKEKWGKLTDDDLNVIEGRRDQLEGKLQQRYGFAKDQIQKDVDDWFKTLK